MYKRNSNIWVSSGEALPNINRRNKFKKVIPLTICDLCCVSKNHKQTVIIIIIIVIHDISGAIKVFLPFNMTPFINIYPKEIKQKCIT